MHLGYRIIRPSDIGTQTVNFAQISLWRKADWGVTDGEGGVLEAMATARTCRQQGIRTVFHPLEYPLIGEHAAETLDMMQQLAGASDLGVIIHDEGGENGRLEGAESVQYGVNVRIVSRLCPVSIENSYNSGDITWFWERFVLPMPETVTITLDIGHLELAGLNSVDFVRDLSPVLLSRLQFVHIHHHDGNSTGWVRDHRPLEPGCREIEALTLLLSRKRDLWVIVELDAADKGMAESIELLRPLGSDQ
jgi:hypothetical protein